MSNNLICTGHENKRCGPCSHEKAHSSLARWDTKHPCTDPGFVCELTGQHVICRPFIAESAKTAPQRDENTKDVNSDQKN